MTAFTLIHPGGRAELEATVEDDGVRVDPKGLEDALGWHLRAEGLCRGDVCVPVREPAALADTRGIDLAAFAQALGLPLAVEPDARVAAVGVSHGERRAALDSPEAPDFCLPDAAGRLHRLSDHRGSKVLLIAYASW